MFASVGALSLLAAARPALAQVADFDPESRLVTPHNTAVLDRVQRGYEPLGVRVGTLSGEPALTVQSGFTDNEKDAETGEKSDLYVKITPRADLHSDWSRHFLGVTGALTQTLYANASEDDSTEYILTGSGRLDVTRAVDVTADLQHQRLVEPRSSTNVPTDTLEPVLYDQDTFQVQAEARFSQIQLAASARVVSQDFGFVRGASTVYDFNFRDGSVTTLTGTVGRPISPVLGVFGQVAYDIRRFEKTQALLNRDSDGTGFLVGAVVDLPQLLRGDVAVGYANNTFSGVFAGSSSSGLRLRASISYFPTPLTTVTLSASRQNVDSGIITSPGRDSTRFSLRADHELLRNVRLGARIGFRDDKFNSTDRDDTILDAGATVSYALNRRVSVAAGYDFISLNSTGFNRVRSFDENRLNLALTLHY